MLSSWSVRQKLLLGFGMVIVVLIIAVLIGAMKMATMQERLEDITENRYPKTQMANQIIQYALDNGRQIRGSLLTNDTNETEKFLSKIDANRAALQKVFTDFEAQLSGEDGKQRFNEVKAAAVALEPHYATIFKFSRMNTEEGMNKGRDFLTSTFTPANNALVDATRKLISYQDEQMVEARNNAISASHAAQLMQFILLAVGIAISLGVAFFIAGLIGKPLTQAVQLASDIREGNLSGTETPPPRSKDESLTVQRDLILMRDSLRDLVRTIHTNATSVSDSAHELSGMAQHVAISAQRQSENTTEAAATLEQLTVSINHVADNADDASHKARAAGQSAARGGSEVSQSTTQIRRVSEQVGETANRVEELTGQVQEIGQIVTVIRDVADQTNLLALNAAIEAARAGEMGRGFAVVADEVRKLAERTTLSAQEITQKISSIQRGSQIAVESMRTSIDGVNQVSGTADLASRSMADIEAGSGEIVASIASISSALSEQRTASIDLSQRMENVAQLSESNSATVEELATTSEELQALAQNLQKQVSQFRL